MALGFGETRVLFTNTAIILGLVYGYLPFMVLPLYAAIERVDWSLVEGARDLYASGWSAFRRVVWPLAKPGVIAGSILVFVPSFGAYVTPAILGGTSRDCSAVTSCCSSFPPGTALSAPPSRLWYLG